MKSPYRLNRRSRKRMQMAVKHNHLPFPVSIAELRYLDVAFCHAEFHSDVQWALRELEERDGEDVND